jgi:hypothetical protein
MSIISSATSDQINLINCTNSNNVQAVIPFNTECILRKLNPESKDLHINTNSLSNKSSINFCFNKINTVPADTNTKIPNYIGIKDADNEFCCRLNNNFSNNANIPKNSITIYNNSKEKLFSSCVKIPATNGNMTSQNYNSLVNKNDEDANIIVDRHFTSELYANPQNTNSICNGMYNEDEIAPLCELHKQVIKMSS